MFEAPWPLQTIQDGEERRSGQGARGRGGEEDVSGDDNTPDSNPSV